MFALPVAELGNLLRVAGNTRICYSACKRHILWHMGVCVAAKASLQFKMALSLMALATLRDLAMDRMTGGTIKSTMFALIFPELSILLRVAGKTNIFVG
jgi:hypothetical protein